MRLAQILLLVCVGCGGGSSTSPAVTNGGGGTGQGGPAVKADNPCADAPPTMPLTGAPEEMLTLFEALAKKVTAAGSSCTAYASAMSSWVTANEARYKTLRTKVKGTTLPKAEEEQFDSRLAEAMGVIVTGASTCGEHDQAWAAFQSFDSLIEGS